MKYASIDIETTGLDFDSCEVIEIGAVVDTDLKTPIEKLPTYRFRIVKDVYCGEPYALAMHRDLFRAIAANKPMVAHPISYLNLEDLYGRAYQFVETFELFLRRNGLDPRNFVAAGKNFANFDANFLRRLQGVGEKVRWHYRTLDPGNMFVLPSDQYVPGTPECCERAGVNVSDFEGNWHTSIFDAQVVVALVKKGLERNEA